MKTDNPWKEAILAHSIRHGHPFWEHDPERSLKGVKNLVLTERWDAERDDLYRQLRDEAADAEDEAQRLSDRLDDIVAEAGCKNDSEAIEKIRQWNQQTKPTPSST